MLKNSTLRSIFTAEMESEVIHPCRLNHCITLLINEQAL
jgi:hypothetical protein